MTKILFIEDDPLMLRLYEKVFKLEGFEISVAADGIVGVNKARTEKPSLILLDIMMPKIDGFQVLSQLKGDAETKAIPVIILTNLAGSQDAEKAIEMGALKYIIKSEHDPKEVVRIVSELLWPKS